jgi:2-amino-4-hydroxy-6-hydroxymethyldihydropteridine diphosphokinase
MTVAHTLVYLALGTNLGDRRANLRAAVERLSPTVAVAAQSSIYETEPAYVADQPRFLNMVLRGHTSLAPHALLRFLKKIEQTLGRVASERYGPRLIDLDILLYGDAVVDEPDLIIPHPRIAERPFVLVPLAELAPDLVLPGQQLGVAALAATLHGDGQIVRVEQGFK